MPPPGSGNGQFTEEGKDIYLRHCFPDIEQIVARVAEVRATPAGRGLKDIYIMTNGKREWVADLKASLRAMGGWDKIASARLEQDAAIQQGFLHPWQTTLNTSIAVAMKARQAVKASRLELDAAKQR